MAEKDQHNDEYEFSEYDSFGEDPAGEQPLEAEDTETNSSSTPPPKKDVHRNALLVIGAIVGSLLIYQLLTWMLKKPEVKTTPLPAPTAIKTATIVEPVKSTADDAMMALKQRIQGLEEGQDKIKLEASNVQQDVQELKTRVDQLANQMTGLTQSVESISNQFARQTEELSALMRQIEALKPKKPVVILKRVIHPRIVYYIQAVIPGRAWLIATNGSTLTVREGSKILGYGMVQLIDSIQGRVLTSSGRVIRFSQDDS